MAGFRTTFNSKALVKKPILSLLQLILFSKHWPFISRHHMTHPSHSFIQNLTVSSAQLDLWFNLTEWCPGPQGWRLLGFSGKAGWRAQQHEWILWQRGHQCFRFSAWKCHSHTSNARIHFTRGQELVSWDKHKYNRCMCYWNWVWR